MSVRKDSILVIVAMIAVTAWAIAYLGDEGRDVSMSGAVTGKPDEGLVTVNTELVQTKVLKGSEGNVSASLTIAAAHWPNPGGQTLQPLDLVIVLDRSGSMEGRKIGDARRAVIHLLRSLEAKDRFAFITYANDVRTVAPLSSADDINLGRLTDAVEQVIAGGGTNLGGGLRQGIDLLTTTPAAGRQRKIILISDGLANQGVTEPGALGKMASDSAEQYVSVSTVGVGLDFNEVLMTAIADQGAGQYHFLEDPGMIAQVFEKEFQRGRNVVASALEIRVPLPQGSRLVHAGGYPMREENGFAVFHPGDLVSGQKRTFFLTFKVPTGEENVFSLGPVKVDYQQNGNPFRAVAPTPLIVHCVTDPDDVTASIEKDSWGEQVVQEEFSRLKDEVADAVREGDQVSAEKHIHEYEMRNKTINAAVGSPKVEENLTHDVTLLRQSVNETFVGTSSAVEAKKKQTAKALQYESYQTRRDKK